MPLCHLPSPKDLIKLWILAPEPLQKDDPWSHMSSTASQFACGDLKNLFWYLLCCQDMLFRTDQLATFVAPLVLHVTSFVSNIGWFFSLVVAIVGSCTFDLSFVLIWWPKLLGLFVSGHISAQATLLGGAAYLSLGAISFIPRHIFGKFWELKYGIYHILLQPI